MLADPEYEIKPQAGCTILGSVVRIAYSSRVLKCCRCRTLQSGHSTNAPITDVLTGISTLHVGQPLHKISGTGGTADPVRNPNSSSVVGRLAEVSLSSGSWICPSGMGCLHFFGACAPLAERLFVSFGSHFCVVSCGVEYLEVVNSICVLSVDERIASCDGTIHIWNGQTGKLITTYSESSVNFLHHIAATTSKVTVKQMNVLTPYSLSGGLLSNAFSGNLYTCMHHLESNHKLIAGMGNGSIRYIDVLQDRKLHLWKTESAEYSYSSLVSAICSCGSEKLCRERAIDSPSWIAAGLSTGYCRLLDARSGSVIAFWRAHDGYITKLGALEDHLLLSSSLDKTLRLWDLRRNLAAQTNIFRGHQDGISSFCAWGQDVISISRNNIALTSVSRSMEEVLQQKISPQKLYSADRGVRNPSALSAISVLPFSRLFLVGTEDGFLKVCC
ncbi:protein GFS12-like [Phalaenopsis equestris]|uniref:protein GFS12-like n=1 Tax=Phalaenopsis equestris TaxID=78828 RepID=UPI0009E1E27B|nr:protein GFS12-like [Phalaenopsis equestris]